MCLCLNAVVHEEECIVQVAKLGATCMCKADKCNRYAIKIPDKTPKGNESNPAEVKPDDFSGTAKRTFAKITIIQPLFIIVWMFVLLTC